MSEPTVFKDLATILTDAFPYWNVECEPRYVYMSQRPSLAEIVILERLDKDFYARINANVSVKDSSILSQLFKQLVPPKSNWQFFSTRITWCTTPKPYQQFKDQCQKLILEGLEKAETLRIAIHLSKTIFTGVFLDLNITELGALQDSYSSILLGDHQSLH